MADQLVLAQLLRFFGGLRFFALLDEGLLKIEYAETRVAVVTVTRVKKQFHDVVEYSSPQHTFEGELRRICIDVEGKPGRGRRLAQRIQDKISVSKKAPMVLEGARRAILDRAYVEAAAKIVVADFLGASGDVSTFSFHTSQSAGGIEVESNLSFFLVNALRGRRTHLPPAALTPAHILAHVATVERELHFASEKLSELAHSSLSTRLAEKKIDYLVGRSLRSRETLSNFSRFAFDDARAIREAVNAGRIDLEELLAVLRRAKRFKEWLVNVPHDADLVRSYYAEVTKESLVEKLPAKSMRWTIFTGLGVALDLVGAGGLGTAAGVALSALDSFVLEKLVHGWRPSQFIEDDVRPLISG